LHTRASNFWAAKTHRPTSASFLAAILGAILTGYGIRAFVWETSLMYFVHIGFGVSMTLLLPLHLVMGRHLWEKRLAAQQVK
jgi:hypothetical protein